MGRIIMRNNKGHIHKVLLFLLGLTAVFFSGCAKDGVKTTSAPETQGYTQQRMITNIEPVVESGAVTISIEGNSVLTYTSVKQSLPLGIVLYFPETGLEDIDAEYVVDSGPVSAVRTNGPNEESSTSRVMILLENDVEYEVNKTAAGIDVVFVDTQPAAKSIAEADNSANGYVEVTDTQDYTGVTETDAVIQAEEVTDTNNATEEYVVIDDAGNMADNNDADVEIQDKTPDDPVDQVAFEASDDTQYSEGENEKVTDTDYTISDSEAVIEEAPVVDVTPIMVDSDSNELQITGIEKKESDSYLSVKVSATGSISNYKDFSIKSTPSSNARIVLDIYEIKSQSKGEEKINISGDYAKQVRYFSYPDRLRMVVDTSDMYLDRYKIEPQSDGLKLTIGPDVSPDTEKNNMAIEAVDKPSEETGSADVRYGKKAWVNKIDFAAGSAGKSAIVLGTSKPVDYKIVKIDDKTLKLILYNAKIPKNRKYPIITTRFKSAVDRVVPVINGAKSGSAEFIIELRELVPYYVDQVSNLISVNFDPSSVAPRPEKEADLPEWKEVLTKEAQVEEIEIAQPDADAAPVVDDTPTETPVEFAGDSDTNTNDYSDVADIEDIPSGDTLETDMDKLAIETETVVPEEYAESKATNIGRTRKAYTGEKIAVDFYETDIKNVFRIIRAVSGDNFAIDKDVTGSVTMTLEKPVPWDQVLDLVLKMNMLGMTKEGNINRIATLETLRVEEQKRLDFIKAEGESRKEAEALEPMTTEYIPVNYSDAGTEIKPHVEGILSERGKLSIDARTNQVIITDTKAVIEKAKSIVERIDKETPQVIIESRIVEASTTFARNIGVRWGIASDSDGIYRSDLGGKIGYGVAMNYSAAASSSIGLSFQKMTGSKYLIDATLSAEETLGKLKIVSAPRIVTLDNKTAEIKQGIEIAYYVAPEDSTDDDDGGEIVFKEVNLKMQVTPHVTADNRVSLKVDIDKNDLSDITAGGIDTKKIVTELLVNDGDTIVIGGVVKSNYSTSERGLPYFSKLPFVGWLFRTNAKSEVKQELLIFITPRILHLADTGDNN